MGAPPEPCGQLSESGGAGTTTNQHFLGTEPGTVTIDYEMFSIQDEMRVYYNGVLVDETGGPVSGTGTLSFWYQGASAGDDYCEVVVIGPANTAWNFTLNCPVGA